MFNILEFINIIKHNFKNTKFIYKYDKNLDLFQIIHDNYQLEIDNNLENRITKLLGDYYYSKGVVNVMVSYDFYNEMLIAKEKIGLYSLSFHEEERHFFAYNNIINTYKSEHGIEVLSHKQDYKSKNIYQQDFYEIGKAS